MTSTTLQSANITPAHSSSVGEALQGLGLAARQLALAVWATVHRVALTPRERTPFEEAQSLRAFADEQRRIDPRFAEDLYAAAYRHEQTCRRKA
jgi:hypothetical protein